jgi:hypothetical protein
VRWAPLLVWVVSAVAACSHDDATNVAVDSQTMPPEIATPTTSEARIELPTGVLVAVPTQNREDPAKNQFQVQIHNGTRQRYDLAGVQFVWDGFTTEPSERDTIIVGGQVIDLPVPFPGADCAGAGLPAEMPPLDAARVVLSLDDGSTVDVPVVDQWHLARKLYLEDCERQAIEAQVAIEWVGLHEAEFEGRPVTAGELRLTRRAGTGDYTVVSVSNTIPYEFMAVDTGVGEPVITLPADADVASIPIRFLESRCDPHALAEIKQPTKFIAQVRLGDGSEHPYIIYPERADWIPMRLTADKGCVALGKVDFVGEG